MSHEERGETGGETDQAEEAPQAKKAQKTDQKGSATPTVAPTTEIGWASSPLPAG